MKIFSVINKTHLYMKLKIKIFFSFLETVKVTTRGCAKQDFSYQQFNHHLQAWETVTQIHQNIYQEGCQTSRAHAFRRHQTEYCYCSEPLCNGFGKNSSANSNHKEALPSPLIPFSFASTKESTNSGSPKVSHSFLFLTTFLSNLVLMK